MCCHFLFSGEKRSLDDSVGSEEVAAKRSKIEGDIPMEVVTEIVETISEPSRMLGPEVTDFDFLNGLHTAFNEIIKLYFCSFSDFTASYHNIHFLADCNVNCELKKQRHGHIYREMFWLDSIILFVPAPIQLKPD